MTRMYMCMSWNLVQKKMCLNDICDISPRRPILKEQSIFFLSETTETKHNEKHSLIVFHLN